MITGWTDLNYPFGHDVGAAITEAMATIRQWQAEFGPFSPHASTKVGADEWQRTWREFALRLTGEQYPFFHPRYAGQMLKPPHPVAVVGYLAAMLINPNAHALDGGPATAAMEKEVVEQLAGMFGLSNHLGHLTSSGTIANLEALWVAREERPDAAIAVSADAHYTHQRMGQVLGVQVVSVNVDAKGRMDMEDLARVLAAHDVGTIVATMGTTGLGAIDPLRDIVHLARSSGVRVHADAAYGGFFALVADDSDDGVASRDFSALRDVDSIVVDPHKHGLQPYGCGAVLFADPNVGRHYKHDSPYTYFSSDELHLGEISLECSRAGAAAAALWLTTSVFPLTPNGLGEVLRPGLRAARRFHGLLEASSLMQPVQAPELDIVGYGSRAASMSEIDSATARIFATLANAQPEQQWHLATYSMTARDLARRGIAAEADAKRVRILRSVFMKPEHEGVVEDLVGVLEGQARPRLSP